MAQVSARQIGSSLLFVVAASVLLSAARINPWVGGWVKGAQAHNYADVQWSYLARDSSRQLS